MTQHSCPNNLPAYLLLLCLCLGSGQSDLTLLSHLASLLFLCPLSFDSVVVSGPSSAAVIGWVGANVGPLRSSDPRPVAYSVAYWALRPPNFVT